MSMLFLSCCFSICLCFSATFLGSCFVLSWLFPLSAFNWQKNYWPLVWLPESPIDFSALCFAIGRLSPNAGFHCFWCCQQSDGHYMWKGRCQATHVFCRRDPDKGRLDWKQCSCVSNGRSCWQWPIQGLTPQRMAASPLTLGSWRPAPSYLRVVLPQLLALLLSIWFEHTFFKTSGEVAKLEIVNLGKGGGCSASWETTNGVASTKPLLVYHVWLWSTLILMFLLDLCIGCFFSSCRLRAACG